jgi:hypothetical protein
MLNHVIADWVNVVKTARPVLGVAGSLLHLDNAPTHRIDEELKELKVTRIPQPAYSPDLSPCDFHLFGYMVHSLRQHAPPVTPYFECKM